MKKNKFKEENSNEPQTPQLNIPAVRSGFFKLKYLYIKEILCQKK